VYKIHVTVPTVTVKEKVKDEKTGEEKEVDKVVDKEFRGVQIVLSSSKTSFTKENLYPEMGSTEYRQIVEKCEQRAGVTHIERQLKGTGVIALLKCGKEDLDVRLDVNILVKTREWYYSQYILECKAPPPPKNGTDAPTMDPTEVATKTPTIAPTMYPVKAPVTAPVKAPNMTPPAPWQAKPPVSFPMLSPMQPTWTGSVSPMSPRIAPSVHVPISSPVASPSVGTPDGATQFPATISTVPPSFESDLSMEPTAMDTPSPVPPPTARSPSVILPTLFTPVAVSCCSDTKINGGPQGNQQLRTVCGPCPELEH
jgi:hypothetical protein